MKKVAIIGPESTGKTSLSRQLAEELGTEWVPEFARSYMESLDRPYVEFDLLEIAKGQLALEKEKCDDASEWLICDTNLVVILIWSQDKFGQIAPALEALFEPEAYETHLLLKPDLPWEYDPMREDPGRLDELFEVYRAFLDERAIPYKVIEGLGEKRLENARLWMSDLQ